MGPASRHRLYDRTAFDAKLRPVRDPACGRSSGKGLIDITCPLARGGSARAHSANMLHVFPCSGTAGGPWPDFPPTVARAALNKREHFRLVPMFGDSIVFVLALFAVFDR